MRIKIRNNNFELHPSGAVFWEEQKILLISDVHLGKVSHFRKHGLAIPQDAIEENFRRLDGVVAFFNPKQIIFLGDLFHSKINNEWNLFAFWVSKMSCEMILVEGNHDIISKEYYADLNIAIFPKRTIGEFTLTHHPTETEEFNFCGHVHPGIKLRDVGNSLKLSCFFQKENQLILPAFGEFTGNYFIRPKENEKAYAIANDKVIRVF